MLNEEKIPDGYWREAIYKTIYIPNRGQLRVTSKKVPYEIWFGRTASVKYFRVFGSKCYIKREDDNPLEEISTQNGPFNANSNSMSSCVSQ